MTPAEAAPRATAPWNPLRRLLIVSLYLAFALAVYIAHGPRPDINIDHIAYFKLANDIRAAHPLHDYWRATTATRSYAVIMAYLYDVTGDHIRTLKFMLALMTVAYLICAEYFFARFTSHRWIAVSFAVASSVHVSFGAVFWGVTDFAASLNRTLVVPPMLLLLGWYFGNYTRRRRLLIYPALIYLSVLHLGTYYLLGVVAAMDGLRLVHAFYTQKQESWLDAVSYLAAFALVAVAYVSIEHFNLGSTVISMMVPRLDGGPASGQTFLSSRQAWEMEIFAQPWRNFPPPLATLLGAGLSLAFILPLSLAGAVLAVSRTGWKSFDKPMLLMAFSVLICAFGLQSLLWIIRKWIPIYPINFEEVRTICFIYLPLLYFILRGFEWLWYGDAAPGMRMAAVAGMILLVVQPMRLVRLLPRGYRAGIVDAAQRYGILDERDSQRNIYARQVLGLDSDRQRFYYCVIPVLNWLSSHTNSRSRVLTNRNELYLLNATVIGTSNGFLNTDLRSPVRVVWHNQVVELDAALASHDLRRVERLAHACGADFAVVPWDDPSGVFDDGTFSVVAIK